MVVTWLRALKNFKNDCVGFKFLQVVVVGCFNLGTRSNRLNCVSPWGAKILHWKFAAV